MRPRAPVPHVTHPNVLPGPRTLLGRVVQAVVAPFAAAGMLAGAVGVLAATRLAQTAAPAPPRPAYRWAGSGIDGGGFVNLVKIAPSGRLLANSNVSGPFYSDDGGATWLPARLAGVVDHDLLNWSSIYFDPDNPNIVYATAGRQTVATIFRSLDGGASWDPLFTPGTQVYFVRDHDNFTGRARQVGRLIEKVPLDDGSHYLYALCASSAEFRTVTKASTISGQNTLIASAANWVTADIGASVNAAGVPAGTTITSFDSPTQARMSANATATASGVNVAVSRVTHRRFGLMRAHSDNLAVWTPVAFNGNTPLAFGSELVRDPATGWLFAAFLDFPTGQGGVWVCTNPDDPAPAFVKMTGASAPTWPESMQPLGGWLYVAGDLSGMRALRITAGMATTGWTPLATWLPIAAQPPNSSNLDGPYWQTLVGRVSGGDHVLYVGCLEPVKGTSLYGAVFRTQIVGGDPTTGFSSWSNRTDDATKIRSTIGGPAGAIWWEFLGASNSMIGGNNYKCSELDLDPTSPDERLFSAGKSGIWRYTHSDVLWFPMVRGLGVTRNDHVSVNPANPLEVWVGNGDWQVLKSLDHLVSVVRDSPGPMITGGFAFDTSVSPPRVYCTTGDQFTNTRGSCWSKAYGDTNWTDELLWPASSFSDTFARAVAVTNGWGTSSSGTPWTVSASPKDVAFSVPIGGPAKVNMGAIAAGNVLEATPGTSSYFSASGSIAFSFDRHAAGSSHELQMRLREVGSEWFTIRVREPSNNHKLGLAIMHKQEAPLTNQAADLNIVLDYNPGTVYRLRWAFIDNGDGTATITASLIPDGDEPPDTPQLTVDVDITPMGGAAGVFKPRWDNGGAYTAGAIWSTHAFDLSGSGAGMGQRALGVAVGRDASGNRVILAPVDGVGVRRKVAAGAFTTITATNLMTGVGTVNYRAHPIVWPDQDAPYVYLFDRSSGVWRSADYGATWALIYPLSAMPGVNLVGENRSITGYIAADRRIVGRLYVTWGDNTGSGGLVRLDQAHAAATPIVTNVRGPIAAPGALDVGSDGTIVCCSRMTETNPIPRQYLSRDDGATWTDISDTVSRNVGGFPFWVAVGADGLIYIATDGQGVFVGTPVPAPTTARVLVGTRRPRYQVAA